MKHILVIDDDLHIGNLLEELLTREGYRVSRAYSGTEALLMLSHPWAPIQTDQQPQAQSSQQTASLPVPAGIRPDLILLDLMLPGRNGEELLPLLKGTPVIILSAKTDIDHKAELLLEGASDYMTKPFHTKELLARVAVQLRNAPSLEAAPFLTFGDLTLDCRTHEAKACGCQLKLTRTEYAVLKILMQNPTQVITKSLLLDRISEDTPDCTEGSLKMHVSNLRRKLREKSNKDYIEAVWGIGFRLRDADCPQADRP